MERQYIQINLANVITITLMGMVGYALLALLTQGLLSLMGSPKGSTAAA